MLALLADAPATPELKHAQRDSFEAVYLLLLGKETGPRLPTLLLSIGSERTRRLLVQQD
jgi:lysyl-tRNA synthetase class 1